MSTKIDIENGACLWRHTLNKIGYVMYISETDKDGDSVIIQTSLYNGTAITVSKEDGDFMRVILTRKQIEDITLKLTESLIIR